MNAVKHINASTILKKKYLRLLADLREGVKTIKKKLGLVHTMGLQSHKTFQYSSAENGKKNKIIIQLESMSHRLEDKIKSISSEIASYQTELDRTKRIALGLESEYLRNMSSLLHDTGTDLSTIT